MGLDAGDFGIKQPHVSALVRNRSGNFSVERLMDFLTALGQDVHISVRPTSISPVYREQRLNADGSVAPDGYPGMDDLRTHCTKARI
ncbi:MAG: XRE family transcriptional regulator [Acidobacteria bacterium]|nr:XRE family transcriptional regulator [Acidobacteriota bacterium]